MLSAWTGLNPGEYVTDEDFRSKEAESLPKMMALLRADPTLTPDSVEAIQELLTVAYRRFGKPALEDADLGREAAARL
jgi:hypothetical protein